MGFIDLSLCDLLSTPPPSLTYTDFWFLCNSPTLRLLKVHHTSDLKESHPKSFLWIIEKDQASLTLIILRSICLASPPITSNASSDRFNQSEGATAARNPERLAPHCLHWRRSLCVIGVFMLRTGMIADWLGCSFAFFRCLGCVRDNSACLFRLLLSRGQSCPTVYYKTLSKSSLHWIICVLFCFFACKKSCTRRSDANIIYTYHKTFHHSVLYNRDASPLPSWKPVEVESGANASLVCLASQKHLFQTTGATYLQWFSFSITAQS